MQRAPAPSLSCLLLCGGALAALSACVEAAGGGEGARAPLAGGESAPAGSATGDPGGARTAEGPPLAGDCLTRGPRERFASISLSQGEPLAVVEFEVRVTARELDAVIGLSDGPATSFAHLAAAVRFAPSGAIDARDGAAYRAEQVLPFSADRTYRVRLVVDAASRTYSAYVHDPGAADPAEVVQIARGYAFRPSRPSAASLDSVSAIVDGADGRLSVCDAVGVPAGAVVYSREGSYAVAPLPDDQVLASDGSSTWKLGADGRVLDRAGQGGAVAADEAGNVYVALASGGQLALHAFTPRLVPRWSRVDPVDSAARVEAIAADAAGVTIALGAAWGVSSILRYPAAGGAGGAIHGGGALAALGRDGFAVATVGADGLTIALHDRGGGLRWSRAFPVAATAEVMTLDLDGRVVLGGHFSAPISFGGPTLEPAFRGEVDVNSYAVALARADGAHAFTVRIPTTRLTGAGAGAGRLVVAGETWVTPIFPHLWELDAAGTLRAGEPSTGFYEQWGRSGRVAVGASGRIYWERAMVWPTPVSPAFPYLLAIAP